MTRDEKKRLLRDLVHTHARPERPRFKLTKTDGRLRHRMRMNGLCEPGPCGVEVWTAAARRIGDELRTERTLHETGRPFRDYRPTVRRFGPAVTRIDNRVSRTWHIGYAFADRRPVLSDGSVAVIGLTTPPKTGVDVIDHGDMTATLTPHGDDVARTTIEPAAFGHFYDEDGFIESRVIVAANGSSIDADHWDSLIGAIAAPARWIQETHCPTSHWTGLDARGRVTCVIAARREHGADGDAATFLAGAGIAAAA